NATGTMTWKLAGNTKGFGNTASDPTWIGDFAGIGHDQVLFYSPGDQNWWLGTCNATGTMTWKLAGNTKGFGNTANDRTWVGDFSGTGHDQVLFYSPGDQNWWLGTCNATGTMTWALAGNTKGFGNTASDPTWIGDFAGIGHDQVLLYSPGDHNWWLGTCNATGTMTWALAGTQQSATPTGTMIGDFMGNGRDQVLLRVTPLVPRAHAAIATSQLAAMRAPGPTEPRLPTAPREPADPIPPTAPREPTEPADPPRPAPPQPAPPQPAPPQPAPSQVTGPVSLLGTIEGGRFRWSRLTPSPYEATTTSPSWVGDFVGARRVQLLQYVRPTGQWPLALHDGTDFAWTTLRSRIADAVSGNRQPPARSLQLITAFVANNPSNELLICSSTDGRAWSDNHLVAGGESTKAAPALASFKGKLWLAFVANNAGNRLLVCSSTEGKGWTPNAPLGTQSSQTAPALAMLGDRLHAAFVANNASNQLLVCSSQDGAAWSDNHLVAAGESTKSAPALASFKGKLWLVFVANNAGNRLLVCSSTDGQNWTSNALLGTQSSQTAPALAVLGDRLYVAFVADNPSNQLLVCSTPDGANWSDNHLVAGGESTKAAPALAAYDGKLWLAFLANDPGNRVLVSSSSDGQSWTSSTPLGTQSSQTTPTLVVGARLS
ncbi:MAG: exo-alpha-sialidase, partial [Frankiaceae bacterium]